MGVRFKFPAEPDWGWLRATYPGGALLNVDASVSEVAARLRHAQAYLATPYSRQVVKEDGLWCRALSAQAELRAARWSRFFFIEGVTAVSPIVLSCAVCHADFEGHVDPLDDAAWSSWCQAMLAASGAVIVPPIDGWDQSRGVWRETCWALANNVPVFLVSAEERVGGVS